MVLIPAGMIYGLLFPWPHSVDALSKYENSIALLSSFKSSYRNSYEKHSKTYLVIKANPPSSFLVRVTIDTNGLYEVKERDGGLTSILIIYVFLGFLTWWSWAKKEKSHNKSVKQTD